MEMINSNQNKLMMSDSLKGMVPELEDENIQVLAEASNSIIVSALEINLGDKVHPLVGSVDGIQIDEQLIKLDMKVSIEEAYDLLMLKSRSNAVECIALQLHFSKYEDRLVGPFQISSPKIFQIDIKSKTCVLAIDLIRNNT